MNPFVRSEHNYDMNEASLESSIAEFDVSRTIQSDKDDADINIIMDRFGKTGTLPQGAKAPTYGDFENIFDFQTAMNAIRGAQEAFMEMPANVRTRFNNDPQLFVEFCSDERNIEEIRKLGLAIPKEVEKNAVAANKAVQQENENGGTSTDGNSGNTGKAK